jgi:hypothetical protein
MWQLKALSVLQLVALCEELRHGAARKEDRKPALVEKIIFAEFEDDVYNTP